MLSKITLNSYQCAVVEEGLRKDGTLQGIFEKQTIHSVRGTEGKVAATNVRAPRVEHNGDHQWDSFEVKSFFEDAEAKML